MQQITPQHVAELRAMPRQTQERIAAALAEQVRMTLPPPSSIHFAQLDLIIWRRKPAMSWACKTDGKLHKHIKDGMLLRWLAVALHE